MAHSRKLLSNGETGRSGTDDSNTFAGFVLCDKGFNPTFEALGIEEKYHKNVIRVSFSEMVKSEEVDFFIKTILEVINDLAFLKKK